VLCKNGTYPHYKTAKLTIIICVYLKDEVNIVVNEVENCKTNKKHYESKLKEHERKIKALEENVDKYKADVEVR